MICVEIEVDDNGQVTVGVCPPEEESGEPKGYMQPAQSVEEALSKAAQMLQGSKQPQGMDKSDMQEQDAAASAFQRMRGG